MDGGAPAMTPPSSLVGAETTMLTPDAATAGQFCWVDLAASDSDRARHFYGNLFGWSAQNQRANGGVFTRLRAHGRDVGSMYQLSDAHLARGVPSHWTPYVRVADAEASAARAEACGGQVIVRPFEVEGVARIALVLDPNGAQLGLWQSTR